MFFIISLVVVYINMNSKIYTTGTFECQNPKCTFEKVDYTGEERARNSMRTLTQVNFQIKISGETRSPSNWLTHVVALANNATRILMLQNVRLAQKFRMDYMWAQAFRTFYRLQDLATSWDQARQICEAEGTSLLIPDSLNEVENLKILMSNMKAHYTAVFVGLHDKFSKGDYVTLNGEPITGTILELLWSPGSPDHQTEDENCVVMTREGLFDDRPCTDINPFICKIFGNKTILNDKCYGYDLGYKPAVTGKCYKFHPEPLSWHDAYLICKSEEGQLAIINSAEEAALVTSFLGEHLYSSAPDPNILYVGFSDLMYPYQYRTIKGQTLEEAGYSSWTHVKEDLEEMKMKHCGAISRTGFLEITWCERPAMFLCEKFLNKTE